MSRSKTVNSIESILRVKGKYSKQQIVYRVVPIDLTATTVRVKTIKLISL